MIRLDLGYAVVHAVWTAAPSPAFPRYGSAGRVSVGLSRLWNWSRKSWQTSSCVHGPGVPWGQFGDKWGQKSPFVPKVSPNFGGVWGRIRIHRKRVERKQDTEKERSREPGRGTSREGSIIDSVMSMWRTHRERGLFRMRHPVDYSYGGYQQ